MPPKEQIHRLTLNLYFGETPSPEHLQEAFEDLTKELCAHLREHKTISPPVGIWGSNRGTFDDSSPQTIVVELSSSERITDELPPL